MKHAVLFAHGSRDPRWREPFEALLSRLSSDSKTQWHLAYMEFCDPTLDSVLSKIASGLENAEVEVLPVFLAAGGHLREDVPRQIQEAQRKHPDLRILQHPPLGENSVVQDALAKACQTMIQSGDSK